MSETAAPAPAGNAAPDAAAPPKAPQNPQGQATKDAAAPEVAPVEKPAPKLHKYKANGKEVEIDLNDVDGLTRRLQQVDGTKAAVEEARKMRAEAQSLLEIREALTKGDVATKRQALRALLGEESTLQELAMAEARELYEKQKSQEGMSDTERKLYSEKEATERELKRYRQIEEQQRYETEQRQMQEQVEGYRQKLGGIAVEALKELGGPDSIRPVLLRGLIPYLQAAEEAGIQADPKALAAEYMEDTRSHFQHITSTLDGESLAKWLGEATVKKLGQYHLAKIRGGTTPQANGAPRQVQQSEKELNELKRLAGFRNLKD